MRLLPFLCCITKGLIRETSEVVRGKFEEKLMLAEKILGQQYEMYHIKTKSVKDRSEAQPEIVKSQIENYKKKSKKIRRRLPQISCMVH